jgi:hypothetical protein
MGWVSKREHDLERFGQGRAAILRAPQHPIPLERLQSPLDWRDRFRWRERKQSALQRLHQKRKERLTNLAIRLKFAGVRIMEAGEAIRRLKEYDQQLEQRRIEQMRTPLGRLAANLKTPEREARIHIRAQELIKAQSNAPPIRTVRAAIFGKVFAGGFSTKPRACVRCAT